MLIVVSFSSNKLISGWSKKIIELKFVLIFVKKKGTYIKIKKCN